MSDLELLQRRLERERAARKAAEALLEQKSRELYRANQQVTELADQTRAIVESAAEGIITYASDGRIKMFNRSARQIFGIGDASGIDIRSLFDPSPKQTSKLFPDVSQTTVGEPTNGRQESLELLGRRAGEKAFPCEVALSATNVGQSTLYTALVRDLTRKKEVEARLIQSQKLESVGQLAAGIAHEINTPIQFVGNNIKFLQGAFEDLGELLELYADVIDAIENGQPTAPVLSQLNEQIELVDLEFLRQEFPDAISQSLEGIERVATIVRAMKEFSSPSADAKATIDINKSIENTVAISANQHRDVAQVKTKLDNHVPTIVGFGAQFNQTVLNIISNSVEAIANHREPGTGLIEVETKHRNDHVEIYFHDNGPGIPAEIRDRIFDPFFTTKSVGKGTGQGLAYVYDVIVNKHSGAITAQAREGGGTTFLVTLPISKSHHESRREHASLID